MQVRAIFEAAADVLHAHGETVEPEIMIPLVAVDEELRLVRELVDRVAGEVMAETGVTVRYQVGTMIELPRACVTAEHIAKHADFFSFGTNDLTQTTYGISRDDAGSFLPAYEAQGIIPGDPFISLDQQGVGRLVEMASTQGRATRPAIQLGICGEHGGDPDSIAFCQTTGLDYVSCSPYRVPIARLAAAQAALRG
jgi:pyruvate,orthophosphate dikinase